MSKGDNSPGLSRLAGVMRNLANKDRDTALVLDFGTIQDDGSLLTNTYPLPVPKADYVVCRHLRSVPDDELPKTKTGYGPDSHTHKFQPHEELKKGDRVLVAWVQNDAVVVDVIIPAESVL